VSGNKARICLWFDGGIGEAADFYCKTFPETRRDKIMTAPADNPSVPKGEEFTVTMTLVGIPVLLLNGGPHFQLNEAASFMVETADQAETDRLWDAITSDGGSESQCGWCKDAWGLSWQITPRALSAGLGDPDPEVAARVQKAMMTMKKIDIAAIEAARRG